MLHTVAASDTLDELFAARVDLRASQARRRTDRQCAARERFVRKQARRLPDPAAWHAWFDGSANPNPGRIGIGAVLRSPEGREYRISRRAGEGDGNTAEYLALIAVLEAAVEQQPGRLIVHGDSQVVIQDVLGKIPVRTGEMEGLRARTMALLEQLGNVELVWIPRNRNRAADALAARAGVSDPPIPDRIHGQREFHGLPAG